MSTEYMFYYRDENNVEDRIHIPAQTELLAIDHAKYYAKMFKPKKWILEKVTTEIVAKEV